MKSEVLFRGKRTDNGEWIYGSLYRYGETSMSIAYLDKENIDYENDVIPETVGVFTGLRALNYERIFEGDILRSLTGKYILVTDSGCGDWTFIDIQDDRICDWLNVRMLSAYRIVDNIHDNPDFMKTYQIRF